MSSWAEDLQAYAAAKSAPVPRTERVPQCRSQALPSEAPPPAPPLDITTRLERQIVREKRTYNILNGQDRRSASGREAALARPRPKSAQQPRLRHSYNIINLQELEGSSSDGGSNAPEVDKRPATGARAAHPQGFDILSNKTAANNSSRVAADLGTAVRAPAENPPWDRSGSANTSGRVPAPPPSRGKRCSMDIAKVSSREAEAVDLVSRRVRNAELLAQLHAADARAIPANMARVRLVPPSLPLCLQRLYRIGGTDLLIPLLLSCSATALDMVTGAARGGSARQDQRARPRRPKGLRSEYRRRQRPPPPIPANAARCEAAGLCVDAAIVQHHQRDRLPGQRRADCW